MATETLQIYKCETCGNIVMVLHSGVGQLVCCGNPMRLMEENTVDAVVEKHVPVIERNGKDVLVKVGSMPHPMTSTHWIEWIELQVDDSYVLIKRLSFNDQPEALFSLPTEPKSLMAREYCNLHGLWKSEE
ncbi:desulfoferrodoxin [Thermodesulfobium sp. 4217-1]|uniref:desulfoferrodoxin n=1 Tax=Thermodesulfobium sp. 4217-1 TaxID=3120013 RepID=UPI0032216F01